MTAEPFDPELLAEMEQRLRLSRGEHVDAQLVEAVQQTILALRAVHAYAELLRERGEIQDAELAALRERVANLELLHGS